LMFIFTIKPYCLIGLNGKCKDQINDMIQCLFHFVNIFFIWNICFTQH